MLSGTAPFDDDSQPKLLCERFFEMSMRILGCFVCLIGIYSFDSSCWEKISSEAKNLIRKMLCVDVEKVKEQIF